MPDSAILTLPYGKPAERSRKLQRVRREYSIGLREDFVGGNRRGADATTGFRQ
ncbi:hypothetical protein GJ744_001881 [Endocarpon pusillum]|uniref:Uncharacterized protein n=1 Tax=Endocarpon pusillum TaxID=364733 RepID=A0A8H7ANG0_9EURO|nr:hypothetical protein GJ744_001881 [Endocarpon pusillum]